LDNGKNKGRKKMMMIMAAALMMTGCNACISEHVIASTFFAWIDLKYRKKNNQVFLDLRFKCKNNNNNHRKQR
jgi:hypothetical protein